MRAASERKIQTAATSRARGILALAGILALLAGCEQSQMGRTSPGLLPSAAPSDDTPPITSTTYFAHAHLLERQGNFEQAVAQYRQVLASRPNFIAARNRLGITLNKLARHEEATREFETAVSQQPTSAYLRNNLGFSLYLEGRFDEAEAELARAVELKPDFDRAMMNHALALAKLQRYEQAFKAFQKVCPPADAYFNIGLLLTEAGRYADAAQYLQGALDLRPDFEAARNQLHEVSRLAAVTPPRVPPTQDATPIAGHADADVTTLARTTPANTTTPATPTPAVTRQPAETAPAPRPSGGSGVVIRDLPPTPTGATSGTTPDKPAPTPSQAAQAPAETPATMMQPTGGSAAAPTGDATSPEPTQTVTRSAAGANPAGKKSKRIGTGEPLDLTHAVRDVSPGRATPAAAKRASIDQMQRAIAIRGRALRSILGPTWHASWQRITRGGAPAVPAAADASGRTIRTARGG